VGGCKGGSSSGCVKAFRDTRTPHLSAHGFGLDICENYTRRTLHTPSLS
jgi:hypothetical protein